MGGTFDREQAMANQIADITSRLPGLFVDVVVLRDMIEGDGIESE